MAEWTSRRRVEAALNHREPDRVPLDMNITLNAYLRLRDHLGLPPDPDVEYDRFFEVRPALDVLAALGVDITYVRLGKARRAVRRTLDDGTELDAWGIGRRLVELPNGSFLNEVCYSPMQDLPPDEIDLDAYPWPDTHDPGFADGLAEDAQRLYDDTHLALMGRFGGPIMEIASYLRGFQTWLMDLVRYPDFARAMLERIADIQIALDEVGIRTAGETLSIFKASGEDLGMQDRPLFSTKVWREVIYPPLARRFRAARAALDRYAPHVKIMLHSDGAFRPFIPDIIAAGIEVLDPIQGICPGMELDGLKHDFGADLTFHGSVDTQHVLPFGSVDEVRQEVRANIESLGHGGGLILAPSHFIQPDVPPENIAALYEAAREFGVYPLGEQ